MMQAAVQVMAADKCRAVLRTECFGALEADRVVELLCQGG